MVRGGRESSREGGSQSNLLGQVYGQHGLRPVEREALEEFERVGDPKDPVEPAAHFIEAFGQRHTSRRITRCAAGSSLMF
jgi:hypothetical protein